MVDFYLPVKILKGKLSPIKDLTLTPPGGAANASLAKRFRSEDDPFTDSKKARPGESHTPLLSLAEKSLFIKKRNLNSLRESMLNGGTSEEGNRTLDQIEDDESEAVPQSAPSAQSLPEPKPQAQVANGGANEHGNEKIACPRPKEREQAKQAAQAPERTSHDPEAAHRPPDPPNVAEADDNDDDEVDEVTLEVLEEMHKLEVCFPTLSSNYRLIDKIGEGTFSTVYKAEAINNTVKLGSEIWNSPPLRKHTQNDETARKKKKKPIVALKQIYVTSSPNRIHNELQLLFLLTGNSHVAPLLDILRYQDQVLAIMPYYQHADYRDFYRDLPIQGVKKYMWELFHALAFIHDKNVIHRDLKPTNFLYDPFKGKGVLVDFGLAERVEPPSEVSGTGASSSASTSSSKSIACPCLSKDRDKQLLISRSKRQNVRAAYPKQDQRPPRRANRAGTRGFRAPEVLFKCTHQLTKLDIWSAGIIGFSFITRKFPLFNSPDDIDALLEIVLVFGLEKLQQCAELHGCGLEINLPHIGAGNSSGNLVKVIADFLRFEWDNCTFPQDSVALDTLKILSVNGEHFNKPHTKSKTDAQNYTDHVNLVQMLNGCFRMDPTKRLSAKEVLKLPFFEDLAGKKDDEVIF